MVAAPGARRLARRTDEHLRGASGFLGAGLGYRELAAELTAYVLEAGFTHVELLPVASTVRRSWDISHGYYAPRPGSAHRMTSVIS